MRLYLVQHGDAVGKDVDPDRPLSETGKQEVGKVGAFLEPLRLALPVVWHSGKLRARQTAELLAPCIGDPQVREHAGLKPNDPPSELRPALHERTEDIMLVGHLPHLASLASLLLTDREDLNPVAFDRGGICCLERSAEDEWSICWMVVPAILPA